MNDTKYRMLVESLTDDILKGRYVAGQLFPSVRALIRRSGLSKTTVQHAVDELARLGLVSRCQGRGTFVTRSVALRKIGMIVPGIASSEFFPPIVSEINRLARTAGYTMLFGEIFSKDEKDRIHEVRELAADFIRQKVAGVIYQPIEGLPKAREINRRILGVFDKAHIPVVLIDSDVAPYPERSAYDVVGINDLEAGLRLANHLTAIGARRILYLVTPNCAASDENRGLGLSAAAACSILRVEPSDMAKIRAQLRRLRPDAVVCCNDCVAAIFRQTLARLGIKVPQDILLAGFGDLPIARLLVPPLTTVRQSCDQIARIAFDRLLDRIADPSLQGVEVYVPAPIVIRESTLSRKS